MGMVAERAGIPAGVFSILTGVSREIGAEMTSNPIVRALTFTGSTEVGRVLMARGRDACDVALTSTFGPNTLTSFRVWADELTG